MIRMPWSSAAVCLLMAAQIVAAQPATRVSQRNMYERVIVVERVRAAAGTFADPHRPLYAPANPWQNDPTSRSGILAYFSLASDDGNFLLVEYVAKDRAALLPVLSDPNVVTGFLKGQAAPADITNALKVYKKDFDLSRFGTMRLP